MRGSKRVVSPTIWLEVAAAGLVSPFSLLCSLFLILHVVDVRVGCLTVLQLRVSLVTAMAGSLWMHPKRTTLVWATDST